MNKEKLAEEITPVILLLLLGGMIAIILGMFLTSPLIIFLGLAFLACVFLVIIYLNFSKKKK